MIRTLIREIKGLRIGPSKEPSNGYASARSSALVLAGAALLLLTGCAGADRVRSGATDSVASSTEAASALPAPVGPVARTASGPVRGRLEKGILSFKGVRYGADTATTRFAAPRPPAPWAEVQDAASFGASCPQTPSATPISLFASWAPVPTPALSEDCLFLNVWTSALADGGKRPVMVWFHGGGFATGSGSSRAYDGTRLVQRGDVVVVTVNHRLNAFGYLALGHYGAGFEDSAAAGVLDMVQALAWVRDNIERFGGDPQRVMIFGESGGGAKVSTLMATDAARGLFHRAVVQSGALHRFPDRAVAAAAADQVVERLGLTRETIAQIKSLPMDSISAALVGTGAAKAPTIDGRTLTRHPFEPDAAPAAASVPLILGTNRTENSLFAGAANPAVFRLDWPGLEAALSRAYPEADVAAIVSGYRALQPDASATDIYFEVTSDARWLTGHVMQAERKVAQGGAPTWLYLFNWDTPVENGQWRSPHALEIGFVFDNVARSESMSGVGPVQQRIADAMADTWIAFARSGDPNNSAIPSWPAYNLEQRPVMVFDERTELVNDARSGQRALLNDGVSYGNRYQQ